jgi:hypothetical protein
VAAVFFVYCLLIFTAIILLLSYLPMNNCKNTVVNWLLFRNNFVTIYVPPLLISAINPFQKKMGSKEGGTKLSWPNVEALSLQLSGWGAETRKLSL